MTYRVYLANKIESSEVRFLPVLNEDKLKLLSRITRLYIDKLWSTEMMRAGEIKAILNLAKQIK